MAFPTGEQIDIIATKILFDAKEAILQLKGWQNSVDAGAQRILLFKEVVKAVAKQLNGDMKAATEAVNKFAKAIGFNPVLLKQVGKELQIISDISKKMGITFDEAQSRFGGFAITIAQGTTNMTVFSGAFKEAFAGGLPLLTATQASLMAISAQLTIIKIQFSTLFDEILRKWGANQLGKGSGGATPLLGSGGAGKGGGQPPDFIDAEWEEVGDKAKKASGAFNDVTNNANKAGEAGEKAGKKTQSAWERVFTPVNALRILLGAIISMLLFQGIQAVTNFFKTAVAEARKFEATLYRLQNAERQLSMEGVEVTLKGLKKGIEDIQKALPIFSKENIAELIGGIATTTKELGFTEEQMLKLGAAVAILNLNSTEAEDLLQTMGKVANSLVSPQAKSIGALSLSFGKDKMEAKALELQILKTGESFDDLTEKEKSFIKYQIVLETANIENINSLEDLRDIIQEAGGDFEALNAYLESNDAKLAANSAAWSDFKVAFGQALLPFLPALTGLLKGLEGGMQALKVALIELGVAGKTFLVIWDSIHTLRPINMEQFKKDIDELRNELTNKFFKEIPKDAPDWFMKGYADRIKEVTETATDEFARMNEEAADNEEAQKALEDLDQKLQDIILDAKQAQEDLDLKLGQKQADLDTDYNRKQEDAAIDHAQKLEDINLDALQKIEDAKRKAREDEKKEEDNLLQKLKELRERFLLDLEEALHKRDARQVLRLIKEYKLEKQNLLDRKKLDDQQRKDTLAADLEAIEIERKRRIENENIEYKRRLADLAQWKAREQEELALWYKREQEDIQRNIEQKIQSLIAGYIAEEKVHAEHQAAIADIIAKYVGYDMAMVERLAQFMATRFGQIAGMVAQVGSLNYGLGNTGQVNPFAGAYADPLPGGTTGGGLKPRNKRAEGGSILATQPTTIMFGERGAELATFTPINRTGLDAGKIFGDVTGGGVNGTIAVVVDLSPDLEGRIIRRSMDSVANVVSKVNNRKM